MGKKRPGLWAVNWLVPKQCPPGVPREMKSPGSFYHLQDGVQTRQTQATRTRKLIWDTAMVLMVPFVGSQDGDLIRRGKMLRRPLLQKGEWGHGPTKCVASSEMHIWWPDRTKASMPLWHAIILAALQSIILRIFVQHLFTEVREKKTFCGEKEAFLKYKTQKRAYVIMDGSNSPKVNTSMFSAPITRISQAPQALYQS